MKHLIGLYVAMAVPFMGAVAHEAEITVGVVNFSKCMESSKYGQYEQKQFETIKTQLQKSIQDLDDQLSATATKLQDKEVLDSLSPAAEKELQQKFQGLSEELNRYQGQYYQIMQQANMKLMHTVAELINEASDVVAKKTKLAIVLNKDAVFYAAPTLEITDAVIVEMDKRFEKDGKNRETKELPVQKT